MNKYLPSKFGLSLALLWTSGCLLDAQTQDTPLSDENSVALEQRQQGLSMSTSQLAKSIKYTSSESAKSTEVATVTRPIYQYEPEEEESDQVAAAPAPIYQYLPDEGRADDHYEILEDEIKDRFSDQGEYEVRDRLGPWEGQLGKDVLYRFYGTSDEETPLIDVKDGVCVLMGVTGSLRSTSDQVSVEISGDKWYLFIKNTSGFLAARVLCIPFSNFKGPVPVALRGGASVYSGTPGDECLPWPFACGVEFAAYRSQTIGDVRDVCWLNRIGGEFNGQGEYAQVRWDGKGHYLDTTTHARGGINAGIECMSSGARLRPFQAPVAEEIDYEWWQGQPSVPMISPEQGFCYLTKVSGNFRGKGEGVFLDVERHEQKQGDEIVSYPAWTLSGYSRQQDVHATAHCVYYQQL